jgi:hypothetical protein
MSFNLLDERWIPILRTDGQAERVGIHEALINASNIRQIAASNPMDNVALLRLLLAVLQWCKPSPSDKERAGLARANGIPEGWLQERLGTAEMPKEEFNLLGPSNAVFQDETAWNETQRRADKKKKTKQKEAEDEDFRPPTDLLQELPSGTNIAHFRHTRDHRDGVCPACCALGLVRLAAFATSGKHGKKQQKPAGLNGATPV